MLSPCRFKSVLALKFIASRVLTALAQASFQPTGQKENAHLCPKSGPCGVRGWSNCLSPQSTQGPPADGAAWPPCGGAACRSLVCAVATPPSTERGPRGRPPATLLPPQSFTWICFPPKTCLPLTWTWFKDFLLCSHSIGHRRGASSPACRARCRHPVRQSRRLRRALREEGTHVCVLQERGRRHGVASAPRGPLLAPGCCGPASPLSEAG